MSITNENELVALKSSGKIVAMILNKISKILEPGISIKELDDYAATLFSYYELIFKLYNQYSCKRLKIHCK